MSHQLETAAAILAAGAGTRMCNDLPKAMLSLGGRPIVEMVVNSARAAGVGKIVVVVGHGAESVRGALGDGVTYAVQDPLLGTAHALGCARPALQDFAGYLLTLHCDIPFVPPEMLTQLVQECADGAAAAMVTVELENPRAYGRILRDAEGRVTGIREVPGAGPEILAIKEINAAVYCFRAPLIFEVVAQIKQDQVKREYYLPDAIGILAARGHRVAVVKTDDPTLVMGINTPEEFAEAERALHGRSR